MSTVAHIIGTVSTADLFVFFPPGATVCEGRDSEDSDVSEASEVQDNVAAWVTRDYYADLSPTTTTTVSEIRTSFFQLSKRCHPDKVREHDKAEATYHFKRINAYEILSDPRTREKYDNIPHYVHQGPVTQFQT